MSSKKKTLAVEQTEFEGSLTTGHHVAEHKQRHVFNSYSHDVDSVVACLAAFTPTHFNQLGDKLSDLLVVFALLQPEQVNSHKH